MNTTSDVVNLIVRGIRDGAKGGSIPLRGTRRLATSPGFFVAGLAKEAVAPLSRQGLPEWLQWHVGELVSLSLDLHPNLKERAFIGWWREGETVVIDLSILVDDEPDAVAFGRITGQRAIFNNSTGETVTL